MRLIAILTFLFLASAPQAQELRAFLNGQEFRMPMNPLAVVSSNNSLIVKYSKVKGERYVGITDALADGFFDEAQCQAVQLLEQAFNDIDEGCADDWVHALTFFYVKDVPHGTKQIDGSRFYYAESDGKTFVFVSLEGRVFFLDSDFLDPQSLINTVVQPEL